MPELEADLEQLVFRDVRTLDEVLQALLGIGLQGVDVGVLSHRVARLLDELKMLLEHGADGEGDLLREVFE